MLPEYGAEVDTAKLSGQGDVPVFLAFNGKYGSFPMHKAVGEGNVDAVRKLLSEGKTSMPPPVSEPPLAHAVMGGHA